MKIKEGSILVIEHGEYSDFSFDGPFRVVKAFDQAEVSETFRDQWKPPNDWQEKPDESDFIAWLVSSGHVELMDANRWHVGSYGFSPEIQPEPAEPAPAE